MNGSVLIGNEGNEGELIDVDNDDVIIGEFELNEHSDKAGEVVE